MGSRGRAAPIPPAPVPVLELGAESRIGEQCPGESGRGTLRREPRKDRRGEKFGETRRALLKE